MLSVKTIPSGLILQGLQAVIVSMKKDRWRGEKGTEGLSGFLLVPILISDPWSFCLFTLFVWLVG